jgi:hypothetical protein
MSDIFVFERWDSSILGPKGGLDSNFAQVAELYPKSCEHKRYWIVRGQPFDFVTCIHSFDGDLFDLKLGLRQAGARDVQIARASRCYANDDDGGRSFDWYMSLGRWTKKGVEQYDEGRMARNHEKMAAIGVYAREVYKVIAGPGFDTIALSQARSVSAIVACSGATRGSGFVLTEFNPIADRRSAEKLYETHYQVA